MSTSAPTATRHAHQQHHAALEHLAIVLPEYVDLLLAGDKTIEARLSRTRQLPFGRVRAGHLVWFKARGGGVRAVARVRRVLSVQHLMPADVERLRREHDHHIRAAEDFWRDKRNARFATLVWLHEVRPVDAGPAVPARPGARGAWWILAHRPEHTAHEPPAHELHHPEP